MTSISDTEVVNAPGGLVELGFTHNTSSVQITSTNSASPTILVSDLTFISDGSPIIAEFSAANLAFSSGVTVISFALDGTLQGGNGIYAGGTYTSPFIKRRLTPSVGTHTIRVVAWRDTGSGWIYAGNGSGTNDTPMLLRVSKILQASQLLVTQSNAPIVTSLPSGNLVTGQEVDLYVTTPYVGYQRYKWNGSAWYVIGDSRAQGVWQSFTPTLTQSSNVTFNVNYAKYVMFGKTVMVNFSLSPTSSGVLNNTILLGFGSGSTALPTAASTNGIHGNFRWFDVGVSNWVGTICGSSTTSVFFTNDGNGNNPGFSGTLTNGDVIEGSFFYEMA